MTPDPWQQAISAQLEALANGQVRLEGKVDAISANLLPRMAVAESKLNRIGKWTLALVVAAAGATLTTILGFLLHL